MHTTRSILYKYCTHNAGRQEVAEDHIGQLQVDSAVQGIEEEDAPEHMQQDEGQTCDSRGNKEVVGIIVEANRPRASHVSQDVDQGECTGDDAKAKARHCAIKFVYKFLL